jgi:hypothetical protein
VPSLRGLRGKVFETRTGRQASFSEGQVSGMNIRQEKTSCEKQF